MKNILFYNCGLHKIRPDTGGTQRIIFNRAVDIVKQRSDVMITLCGNNVGATVEINEHIVLTQIPHPKDRQELLNLYDVVVFFSTVHDFRLVKKKPGQIWILDLHFWEIEREEADRITDFDVICTRSEIHQKHIQELTNNQVPVHYVYNDLSTELFKPLPGVQRTKNSIAYAGAIVRHKGVEKVIQAFLLLKQNIPDLSLNIYGSATMWNHGNDYERYLRSHAAGLVTFHGAISYQEMPRVFSENSILVLPSMVESFSLVSIEAQACGCIPVIHNSGGVGATVIDGETGFLYSPNTYEGLARSIVTALPVADRMREAARKFVINKFENTLHAKRYTELLLQTDFTTWRIESSTPQPKKTHSQLLHDTMDR